MFALCPVTATRSTTSRPSLRSDEARFYRNQAFGAHPLDCEFCGGCVQICPVGAITSRLSMYEYRPWMLKRADTVCMFCGDGCQITVQNTKDQELIEVNSAQGAGRNSGDLCARGFFGFHAASHPSQLTMLIRRNGALIKESFPGKGAGVCWAHRPTGSS